VSFKKYLAETEQMMAEAVPLRKALPYRRAWDPNTYAKLFKSVPPEMRDRGGFRIYLPYEDDEDNTVYAPYDISQALADKGYEVQDYVQGLAKEKGGKRVMKIGRLLADKPDLQKRFMNDSRRAGKKTGGKLVVISRHPYDIAGMSYDRGWTSCMNIGDGINRHYVMHDVKEGTLVAYLIRDDDKNIRHPISRLLIKPFVNRLDPDDILLATDAKQYGTHDSRFAEIVEEWLAKVNGPDKRGLYCLKSNLYDDGKSIAVAGKLWGGSPDEENEIIEEYLRNLDIEPPYLKFVGDEIILDKWRDLSHFCNDVGDYTLDYLIALVDDIDSVGKDGLSEEVIRHALGLLPDELLRKLCERFDVPFAPAKSIGFNRMLAALSANPEVAKEMIDAVAGGSDLREMLLNRIDQYVETGWRFEMSSCYLDVPKHGEHYAIDEEVTLRIRRRDMMEYIENHIEDPNDEGGGGYNDLWRLTSRDASWSSLEDGYSDSEWRGIYSDNPLTDENGDDLVFGSKRKPKINISGGDDAVLVARAYEEFLRNGGQGRIEHPDQTEMPFMRSGEMDRDDDARFESFNPMRRFINAVTGRL